MQIVEDFYNKLVTELRDTYFNNESKFNNDDVLKICNTVELFNNGCMYYIDLIRILNKICNADTTIIVDKYLIKD